MARAIYDGRRFDELPILADALEEAGCTDAAILAHCRRPGGHKPEVGYACCAAFDQPAGLIAGL